MIRWGTRAEQEVVTGTLADLADNILGRSFCPLGDAAAMPVQGFIKHFREEFEDHVSQKGCRANRRRRELAGVNA